MSTNVVLRCDGSNEMGFGHIYRCKTIATELEARGLNCVFIIRGHQERTIYEAVLDGFNIIFLNSYIKPNVHTIGSASNVSESWLGASREVEVLELNFYLQNLAPLLLIVDNYAYDQTIIKNLVLHKSFLVLVDDLNNRNLVGECLINHNAGFRLEDYDNTFKGSGSARELLIGLDYCLISAEFRKKKRIRTLRMESKYKLLIAMGSVDSENYTEKVLRSLHSSQISKKLEFHVMLSKSSPNLYVLKEYVSNKNLDITFHLSPSSVEDLYNRMDLAIGAGGTGCWERCANGLPTVIIATAENQIKIIQHVVSQKAAVFANLDSESSSFLPVVMEEFLSSPKRLKETSIKAANMVDGLGVKRAVDKILSLIY